VFLGGQLRPILIGGGATSPKDEKRQPNFGYLLLLLLLYAVTHAPFHAPVLRPTSWPNARDRRDGEVN